MAEGNQLVIQDEAQQPLNWTPGNDEIAVISNCIVRPAVQGATVQLTREISPGLWMCKVLAMEATAAPAPNEVMVINTSDLVPVGAFRPGVTRAYSWHHWNRSGQVGLFADGNVVWKHNDEEPGKELGPSKPHGFWRLSEELLTVFFHHMGEVQHAKPHFFKRMEPGSDHWQLIDAYRPDQWCILIPLPVDRLFAGM